MKARKLFLAARALPRLRAQKAEGPSSATEGVGAYLQNIESKLVRMGEDWPEELYDYRQNEETRSFGEILRPRLGSNHLILSRVEQRPRGDMKQFAYTNKAAAVPKRKASYGHEGFKIFREMFGMKYLFAGRGRDVRLSP